MTAFSTANALQNQMNQLASSLAIKDAQIAAYQNQLVSQYAQAQQAAQMGGSGGGGGGGYAYPGSVGSSTIVRPSPAYDEDGAVPIKEAPIKSTALEGLLEDLL